MTTSAPGTASSGFLPASLAALLNAPPSPLAPQMPQFFGTTAVGSMFSAPPPPPSTATATLLVALPAATTASLDVIAAGSSVPALSVVPTVSGGTAASVSPVVQPPPPMPASSAPAPPAAALPAAPSSTAAIAVAPFHFANQITIRLTPDNYLFWRAKVLPLLRSHDLLGYVDGSLPCPPQVIMTMQGPAINPEHRVWVQQDQAILSAIQGSLGEGVAGLVLFAATSMDAWTTLEHAFATVSTSRTMALRRQLGEIKKLDSSASTYFNKIKVVADTLASLGQPLRDEEFAGFVLQGLDSDYDNLAEAVNGAKTPMPPHELYSRLQFTEQRVEARRTTGIITDQAAAHWANRGQRPPAPPGAGSAPPPAAKPAPPPTPTTGGGRAGDTRVCQLCGRPGHLASKCHRRFQRSFLGIGNNGQGNERQAQLADFGPPPAAPAAFVAAKGKETIQGSTPSYPIDPAWYMDTGATDHLTSELNKLTTHQPYYGHDKVHTANGAGIGRGARLELLPDSAPTSVSHVDPAMHVHAPGSVPDTASSPPGDSPPGTPTASARTARPVSPPVRPASPPPPPPFFVALAWALVAVVPGVHTVGLATVCLANAHCVGFTVAYTIGFTTSCPASACTCGTPCDPHRRATRRLCGPSLEGPGPAAALVIPGSTVLASHCPRWVSTSTHFWRWDTSSTTIFNDNHLAIHIEMAKDTIPSSSVAEETPVTYGDLTGELKKKYDEIKSALEADLIGSFHRPAPTASMEGVHTGALDGVDLSTPSEERTRSLPGDKLHGGSFRTAILESLVNTLERVAARDPEIMSHRILRQTSPRDSPRGSAVHSRPPLPFALAAPKRRTHRLLSSTRLVVTP
ncbi:hypothetical protein QYE76_019627 [Lolium multiflorum]|uniref:CCHC-type domain-containing protein n=1 Tax=Lolium multiflorum TaxID=4521 RepID=A0AAD8R4U5_LOLMU|nr:hypothetical protein QYE76_019627 [Lolium multiflorum]